MGEPELEAGRVKITDVEMPFWSMVTFMVKWAIASIPALLILVAVGFGVALVLGGAGAALVSYRDTHTDTAFPSQTTIDSILAVPTATPPVPASNWLVSETKNPIDDSPTIVLSLDASSPAASRVGGSPTLILRCRSSRTELYVTWHEYLGLEETRVTVRVGRAPARSSSWSISTDNRASFYPGSPISFIKEIMGVDTLVVMTTPYGESPVTAIFPVSGLSETITPLREACKW